MTIDSGATWLFENETERGWRPISFTLKLLRERSKGIARHRHRTCQPKGRQNPIITPYTVSEPVEKILLVELEF